MIDDACANDECSDLADDECSLNDWAPDWEARLRFFRANGLGCWPDRPLPS